MEHETTKELIELFEKLIEKASDRNGCLTELAKARGQLISSLPNIAFNSEGRDINGVQSWYKAIKEQADKIDQLIRELSGLNAQ